MDRTQFNLSEWLKDKSRKIITRDKKPVRIICWDSPNKGFPIVGFIDDNPTVFVWDKYGYALSGHRESNRDLFFANEEEELTEFEQCLKSGTNIYVEQGRHMEDWDAKEDAKELLNFARKELRKEQQDKLGTLEMPIDVTEPYYIKGKQDALKSLPKWKKATEKKDLEKHIAILEENKVLLSNYLEEGDYYIDLEDLKTLPKEE